MFPLVFFLFIAMPIIEIAVLIQVGSQIGALATIALVILTAVVGTALLRAQGIATWASVQRKMAQGELPAMEMFEGMALLVGGALLLTPGFVTDTIGLLCLIPTTRRAIVAWMLARAEVRVATMREQRVYEGEFSQHAQPDQRGKSHNVLEGEYRREDD
jgi:UPF0716 protein FxsA